MPSLDLYLHDRLVGTVQPDRYDRSRVTLDVDRAYRQEVLLSESFTVLPGRRPSVDAVSNFLGGYVPEGRHRDAMAAKRRIDKDDLFALLWEFGGSIAGAVTLRPSGEPKRIDRGTNRSTTGRCGPSSSKRSGRATKAFPRTVGRHCPAINRRCS